MSGEPGSTGGDTQVRDELARIRTVMANERTLLSYARTSLMLAVTGATIIKLTEDTRLDLAIGWGLLLVSVVVAVAGLRQYGKYRAILRRAGRP